MTPGEVANSSERCGSMNIVLPQEQSCVRINSPNTFCRSVICVPHQINSLFFLSNVMNYRMIFVNRGRYVCGFLPMATTFCNRWPPARLTWAHDSFMVLHHQVVTERHITTLPCEPGLGSRCVAGNRTLGNEATLRLSGNISLTARISHFSVS